MSDIQDFTRKFTDRKIDSEKRGNMYYLRNDEILEMIGRIPQEPISMTMPLGKEGEKFNPTIYLLELLSKQSDNKVFLNDKAEWLFLCGRDAFEESVIKDQSKSDIFLVQNGRDENLGLGIKKKIGNRVMVKNILDRGDFLRRER